MAERKALSVRTRFEVFKRDGFKCQYCGRSAPEAVLEVDHINPVSNDGENDLLNLITACWDCNSGKSDKLLSDDAAVTMQIEQLQILNERRNQLEMLLEWKKSLRSLTDVELNHVHDIWQEQSGTTLTGPGLTTLKKHIKQFGLDEVVAGIDIACSQYTDKTVAFNKLGGICFVRKKRQSDPTYETQAMVRGILHKRGLHVGTYLNQYVIDAIENGWKHEEILKVAKTARSWTAFYQELQIEE